MIAAMLTGSITLTSHLGFSLTRWFQVLWAGGVTSTDRPAFWSARGSLIPWGKNCQERQSRYFYPIGLYFIARV